MDICQSLSVLVSDSAITNALKWVHEYIFPKDVNAFAKMTAGIPLGTLLAPLHELNVHFRGSEEHI